MPLIARLFAAAALLAPAAAFAQTADVQSAEHRFTHRGVTYVYSVAPDAKGRKVVGGYSQPGGSRFRLVVDGARVEGVSGGQPVAFRAPRESALAVAAR